MNKFDGKNDGRGVQDARKKISISPLDAIHAILLLSLFGNIFSLENTSLGKHQHLPITSDQGMFCDSNRNARPCSTSVPGTEKSPRS